jgi:hypothetical protein
VDGAVVYRRTHPSFAEVREQSVSLSRPGVEGEQVVAAPAASLDEPGHAVNGRRRQTQVRQLFAQERLIAAHELFAAGPPSLDARKLRTEQRGVEVGQVCLVAELDQVPVLVQPAVPLGGGARDSMVA